MSYENKDEKERLINTNTTVVSDLVVNIEKQKSSTRIRLEDLDHLIKNEIESNEKEDMKEQELSDRHREFYMTFVLKKYLKMLDKDFLMKRIAKMIANEKFSITLISDYVKEPQKEFNIKYITSALVNRYDRNVFIYKKLDDILTKSIDKKEYNGIDWNKSIYDNLRDRIPLEYVFYIKSYIYTNYDDPMYYIELYNGGYNGWLSWVCCLQPVKFI